MLIPEKLKINRFRFVDIPKNSDYFARLGGQRPIPPASAYVEDSEGIPRYGNKTDILAHADAINMEQIRREAAEARDRAQREEEQ